MKKTIVLLSLMTVASMTFADNSDSKTTLKLPSNSVACYGTVAGMCDSQWAPITHEQLVSNVAGEPSIVTSIHYFFDRDDKIILEYTTVEMDYIQRMSQYIGGRVLGLEGYFGLGDDKHEYLALQESIVSKECPKKNGCQILFEFIDSLRD
ncbi:hypothetical protein AB6E39_15620 [Vibrio splendidus]|uniref:hypothetical protein n=1 Tax=Vibrio TaxID=662 RepID=UPI000C81B55D|nr:MULTISPECIES: hypothetical protein [Vibrio]MCC4789372.1 hypothetical protein [Vibrio splendidus]PMN40108.1 hypothetical protein BCT34_02995 [Vibrio sp. 10N.261.45.E2]PMN47388.1 hypothetical protein BCT32_10390 [Vibrio sp. 10N.261.45.E11]CAK1934075.1 DUF4156 domain-containing protein [Vibrio crassostreae]